MVSYGVLHSLFQLEAKTREYNELREQIRVVTKEKGVAIREHCNLFTELQELRSQVCGRGREGEEEREGGREGREKDGREGKGEKGSGGRGGEGRGGEKGKGAERGVEGAERGGGGGREVGQGASKACPLLILPMEGYGATNREGSSSPRARHQCPTGGPAASRAGCSSEEAGNHQAAAFCRRQGAQQHAV